MVQERRALLRAVLLQAAIVMALPACGSSTPAPDVIPGLPGDGDTNTARPLPPDPKDMAPRDPWAGRDDLIAAPEPALPRALDLPPVERFTLKNGLRVIAVKSSAVPMVHVQLAVRAGRADSPRDKMGLAQFVASMLSKGTRTRTARQIVDAMEEIGGSLSATATYEATLLSCSALRDDFDTCLTLLSDITMRPTFPEASMAEVSEKLRTAVRQRASDPGQLAGDHLQNLLWGEDHARGWPMSERTIAAISRADLQAWYRTRFVPQNAILTVAGEFEPQALRADLTRAFGAWRSGKAPAQATFSGAALTGSKVRVVDWPGQPQAHIHIGQLGIAHDDPAFLDHEVFNHVLGGGAWSSRLAQVARRAPDAMVGVSSSFEHNRERGTFAISALARPTQTLPVLKVLLDEINKMKDQGPQPAEVRSAIAQLTGAYATRFQSAGNVARALLVAELHGLGAEYAQNYPVLLARVTAESARRAAARTLTPHNLAIVIVGDARQITPQLDGAGWAYETVSALSPVAGYERELAATPVPVDPKAEAAGRALLDKALNAKGGAARLSRIKTVTLRAKGKIIVGAGELTGSVVRRLQAPDRLRMDIELNLDGGTADVVTVLSRDKAWNMQPGQGVIELPRDTVAELKRQIWRDPELILLHHKDKGTRVESLGEKTVAGSPYNAVQITRGNGQATAILYLDKKTHLPAQVTYSEDGLDAVDRYSDYRPVDGIQIPHHRRTESQAAVLELEVTSVTLNDPMDDALFSEPR